MTFYRKHFPSSLRLDIYVFGISGPWRIGSASKLIQMRHLCFFAPPLMVMSVLLLFIFTVSISYFRKCNSKIKTFQDVPSSLSCKDCGCLHRIPRLEGLEMTKNKNAYPPYLKNFGKWRGRGGIAVVGGTAYKNDKGCLSKF